MTFAIGCYSEHSRLAIHIRTNMWVHICCTSSGSCRRAQASSKLPAVWTREAHQAPYELMARIRARAGKHTFRDEESTKVRHKADKVKHKPQATSRIFIASCTLRHLLQATSGAHQRSTAHCTPTSLCRAPQIALPCVLRLTANHVRQYRPLSTARLHGFHRLGMGGLLSARAQF